MLSIQSWSGILSFCGVCVNPFPPLSLSLSRASAPTYLLRGAFGFSAAAAAAAAAGSGVSLGGGASSSSSSPPGALASWASVVRSFARSTKRFWARRHLRLLAACCSILPLVHVLDVTSFLWQRAGAAGLTLVA